MTATAISISDQIQPIVFFGDIMAQACEFGVRRYYDRDCENNESYCASFE
jgi:hypothetical protein